MKANELITKVYFWPGSGYGLFDVEIGRPTKSEEDALDQAVTYIVNNDLKGLFIEVSDEWISENQDEDGEIEGLLYWDATMEGADRPVYIYSENLKFA